MNVKEFYENIGADYDMAIATFLTEDRLMKFLKRYATDPSYQRLVNAASCNDIKEAFEGAHALKGVSGMFFLTPVYKAVCELTEQLRPQNEPVDQVLLNNVINVQELVVHELNKLLSI